MTHNNIKRYTQGTRDTQQYTRIKQYSIANNKQTGELRDNDTGTLWRTARQWSQFNERVKEVSDKN